MNGGIWSPAIGSKGHVYGMAANIMFVFPPPRIYPGRDIPGTAVEEAIVR
ncbi:MAG: hypothetical protein ABIQ49_07135 [Gemmatimonadales bacterium]